jgi:hypothetical protein
MAMNDIRALDAAHDDADQPAFTRPGSESETLTRAMKKLAQPHNFRQAREPRDPRRPHDPVRTELVNAVRARIAAGEYESDEWLVQAVDLMLEAVAAEETSDCE